MSTIRRPLPVLLVALASPWAEAQAPQPTPQPAAAVPSATPGAPATPQVDQGSDPAAAQASPPPATEGAQSPQAGQANPADPDSAALASPAAAVNPSSASPAVAAPAAVAPASASAGAAPASPAPASPQSPAPAPERVTPEPPASQPTGGGDESAAHHGGGGLGAGCGCQGKGGAEGHGEGGGKHGCKRGGGYHGKHPGKHRGKPGCKRHGKRRPRVFGRIQAWAVPMIGADALVDNHDAANAAGFRLRKARLGTKGHLTPHTVYSLELELADQRSGRTGVVDAWVAVHPGFDVDLTLGVQRVPLSHGATVSSARMQLPERALGPTLMADHREMGLAASGAHDLVDLGAMGPFGVGWSLGAYNGAFGAFSRGDDNPGLLYAGRLELGLGDIGPGDADMAGGGLRLRLGAGAQLNDSSVGDTRAFAGDLRIKMMGASLVVAHLQDVTEPSTRPEAEVLRAADVARQSSWIQFGYMLWPGHMEAAFRFEMLDDSDAADDAGDVRLYTGGLNYFLRGDRLKVQAAFVRRQEMKGPAVDNDALVISTQARF